jgi:hypothetical protein
MTRSRRDPEDDGGGAWGPSPGFLVVAAVLVAGGLAAWLSEDRDDAAPAGPVAASAASAPAMTAARPADVVPAVPTEENRSTVATARPAPTATAPTIAATTSPTPHIVRQRDPNGDQTPDLSDYLNDGEVPSMAEVIDRLHAAGIYSGLGAFNPPGTRPPKIGLAVPEDFVLPEGYVRHYQATDDGQRIEPILMFSPDFQFVDAAGRPIAIPPDRVVPPELAPPGLPLRRIVVPAPIDSPRRGG